MKSFEGWWFPDHEEHLQGWMRQMQQDANGRLGYQYHKYEKALEFVRGRGLAIDVGAHVGLWSWPMSHDFEVVAAFEPIPSHRECYRRNLAGRENVALHECALGPQEGAVSLQTRTPDSSGDTGVEPGQKGDTPMRTLDSFNLNPDFIKIDCEGYELFVLQGAVETIRRSRPCIIVEQKPETGMEDRYGIGATDAVDFLKGMGATLRTGLQGDYILSF